MTDKTTFVFVPGLMSDGTVWQPVADAFSKGTPTRIADVSRDDSLSGMAQRILDEGPGDLVIVGHSMGGRVAMETARLAPSRVRAMVLADTGYHPLAEDETAKREAMIALGHDSMDRLCDAWLPPMVDDARRGDRPLMQALRAMVMRAGPHVHERQIRALIGRPDAGASLPDTRCPILLVVGRTDSWSPVAQHQEIAELAPDADLVVIEGAGHFAPIEKPEETARAITGWLSARGLL